MPFKCQNRALLIEIPNKNQGKFRFKRRLDRRSFGASFATAANEFDSHVYLEWQISYDVPARESRKTSLKNPVFKFTGANKREKRPFELSEYLYHLIKNGVLPPETIKTLKQEAGKYHQFFPARPEVMPKPKAEINGLSFDCAVTELPAYYYLNPDGTFSEIVIQKQQYAAGFQAMVYFCIPIERFLNGREMIGFSSKEKAIPLIYRIDSKNAENAPQLLKILAMSSPGHQYDVMEILKSLERGLSL